jgi:hypothetical protein
VEVPKYVGKTQSIIRVALKNLGLDHTYLLQRLGLPFQTKRSWNSRKLGACEWVEICHALRIPIGSISWGYSYQSHKAELFAAWKYGLPLPPRTPARKKMFRDIRDDKRRDRKWLDEHHGLRLRWKSRYYDFKEDLPHRFKRIRRDWFWFIPKSDDRVADPSEAPAPPEVIAVYIYPPGDPEFEQIWNEAQRQKEQRSFGLTTSLSQETGDSQQIRQPITASTHLDSASVLP